MTAPEMPIFTRTFDLLGWLLQASHHLPRAHRHDFTKRLLDAAFDLREFLEEANARRGDARRERLARADEALAKVRLYLRLANRLGWLSAGQYGHAAELVAEVGQPRGLGQSRAVWQYRRAAQSRVEQPSRVAQDRGRYP